MPLALPFGSRAGSSVLCALLALAGSGSLAPDSELDAGGRALSAWLAAGRSSSFELPAGFRLCALARVADTEERSGVGNDGENEGGGEADVLAAWRALGVDEGGAGRVAFVRSLAERFEHVAPGKRAVLAEQALENGGIPAELAAKLLDEVILPLWALEELEMADDPAAVGALRSGGETWACFVAAREPRRVVLAVGPLAALLAAFVPGAALAGGAELDPAATVAHLPPPFPPLAIVRPLARVAGGAFGWRAGLIGLGVLALATLGFTAWRVRRDARRRRARHERDYLYAVTHELKTPLATITLCAETLALHGESDPAAVPRFAQMIRDEAERLRVRVHQVLELAAGKADVVDPTRFDPRAVLEAVVADYLPGAQQAGVRLVVEASDAGGSTDATVRGAPELLAQAVGGLLENAIRHGVSGTVRARAELDADRVRITVEDEGPGVPAAERAKLFELRAHSVGLSKGEPGAGLGLALVRQCVEALRGRVYLADSTRGARFEIELPCERAAAPEEPR